ncbi:MAG: TIGR04211 family SH3 domain-containing protein [Pseudomonadales bacterium]
MSDRWRFSLALLFALACLGARADYVTDKLRVEVRSGPSSGQRIINYLPAGTRVDILERVDGFASIRTAAGTEGWMDEKKLTSTPGAEEQLEKAQAQIAALEGKLKESMSGAGNIYAELEEARKKVEALTVSLGSTTEELERIKSVSSNALQAAQQLQSMQELNERLRSELKDTAAERERQAYNLQQRWMLVGAGLVFGGLLLGVMIKSRPRRSGWS